MSATTTETRPETKTGHDDSDEYAHIVLKDDQMKGYIFGVPIKALCGKEWVPSRDPESLPVCPECLDIKAGLLAANQN